MATFYNCISKYSIYDIPELSGSLMVMPPTVSVLTFALFNVNFLPHIAEKKYPEALDEIFSSP